MHECKPDVRARAVSDAASPTALARPMLLFGFMLDSDTAKELIRPHMPVVCSENGEFATVDHVEGRNAIKLTKDDRGEHHFIPLSWVTSVDDKVHIDRPGKQAMREWTTTPPKQ